jgi:hypothetical protein
MSSHRADDSDMCVCSSLLDGYRYDPPTDGYVHKGCGKPRADGPTMASVLAFIDRILEKDRQRERADGLS